MASKTIERLSEVIRQRAANCILFELKDPRLGFITITRVSLTRDLSECTIFYSVMGNDGSKSKTRHGLADARGYVQRQIAKALKTRTAPTIAFEYDASVEGAVKMGSLLQKIRDERPPEEEGEEGEDGETGGDGEAVEGKPAED